MKFFKCMKRVVLVIALLLPMFSYAEVTPAPKDTDVFKLSLKVNGDTLAINAITETDGYLRIPQNGDRQYYVFTGKKYIELAFDDFKGNNKKITLKGVNGWERKTEISEPAEKHDMTQLNVNRYSIIVPWDCERIDNVTYDSKSTSILFASKDVLDMHQLRACVSVEGRDSIFNLEDKVTLPESVQQMSITRSVRAEFGRVSFGGEVLPKEYYHFEIKEQQLTDDDIAYYHSSFVLDSLPELKSDTVNLEVTIKHFDAKGDFVSSIKHIRFAKSPKEELWYNVLIDDVKENVIAIIITMGVIFLVLFIAYLLKRLKKIEYVARFKIKCEDGNNVKWVKKKLKKREGKANADNEEVTQCELDDCRQCKVDFDGIADFKIVKCVGFKKIVLATLDASQIECIEPKKALVVVKICGNEIKCDVGDVYERIIRCDLKEETKMIRIESNWTHDCEKTPESTDEVQKQPDSVFERVTDKEVAQIVRGILGDDKHIREAEVRERLVKYGLRDVCNKWNEYHSDVVQEQVPRDNITVDGLFKAIEKGYIGFIAKNELYSYDQTAKTYSDALRAYATNFENKGAKNARDSFEKEKEDYMKLKSDDINKLNETLNKAIDNHAKEHKQFAEEKKQWSRKVSDVENQMKNLLNSLKDLNYEVTYNEGDNAEQLIAAIYASINKGVSADKQKQQIDELTTQLQAKVTDINDLQIALDKEKQNVKEVDSSKNKAVKELEEKQKQEITELKNRHNQELSSKDKEKESALLNQQKELTEKNDEKIQALEVKHKKEIEDLKSDCEKKLSDKERSYETLLGSKEQEHQRAIEEKDKHCQAMENEKNNEISRLNDTITDKENVLKEKDIEAHSDCVFYAEQIMKISGNIKQLIENLCSSSESVAEPGNLYINAMKNVANGFNQFLASVQQCVSEKWQNLNARYPHVQADLQAIIKQGLSESGWVNIISYLNLYAGASPELNDLFSAKGLAPVELRLLFAEVQRLLGMFEIKIVVPNLLADVFDEKAFEYSNADQWIRFFAPAMRPSDYESRIFDMSCIGYQIGENEYVKPQVYFN